MSKFKVHIFYPRVYDYDGAAVTVGGVQTYLLTLAAVLTGEQLEVSIIQFGNKDFNRKIDNDVNLVGYNLAKRQMKSLFDRHASQIDRQKDLVIWGADTLSEKIPSYKAISIQHGVYFDYLEPNTGMRKLMAQLQLNVVTKLMQSFKAYSFFTRSEYKVCVDYNYLSWYRTFSAREGEERIFVIPNFASVSKTTNVNFSGGSDETIKILVARRFTKIRGIAVMADIVESLNKRYKNLSFTFAGEGELEPLLASRFKDMPNVHITKYDFNDSLRFHGDFHIAVVPTLASEGTSLSLLEAMGAGCAVVASNIGGITNILLNNYNGMLTMPFAENIMGAVEYLINNPEERKRVAKNAIDTIKYSFNAERWADSWKEVVRKVNKQA